MDALDKLAEQVRKIRGPDVLKGIYLNAWLYGSLSLSVKNRESDTSLESLIKLNGACGHRDIVFRDLCGRLGWKSRRIGFHNIPIQVAHVGTEVWIDGEWRFFDPTFGIFISEEGSPKVPISLEKARAKYPKVEIRRTTTPAYQGKWLKSVSPNTTILGQETLSHALGDWPILKPYHTYLIGDLVPEDETGRFMSEIFVPLNKTTQIDLNEEDLGQGHIDIGYGKIYVAYANTLGLSLGRGPVTSLRLNFVAESDESVLVALKTRYTSPDSIFAQIGHSVVDYNEEAMTAIREVQDDGAIHWRFPVRTPGSTLTISTLGNVSAIIEALHIKTLDL